MILPLAFHFICVFGAQLLVDTGEESYNQGRICAFCGRTGTIPLCNVKSDSKMLLDGAQLLHSILEQVVCMDRT